MFTAIRALFAQTARSSHRSTHIYIYIYIHILSWKNENWQLNVLLLCTPYIFLTTQEIFWHPPSPRHSSHVISLLLERPLEHLRGHSTTADPNVAYILGRGVYVQMDTLSSSLVLDLPAIPHDTPVHFPSAMLRARCLHTCALRASTETSSGCHVMRRT